MKHSLAAVPSLATAAIFAAALLTIGCVPDEALCVELLAAIRPCDLQPAELRCDALSYADKLTLLEDLDQEGCSALRDEERRVRDDACAIFGWPCPPPIGSEAGWTSPSRVLYVSGIDGSPAFDWHPTLLDSLRAAAVDVEHVRLPPWASVEERSARLARHVTAASEESGTGRVHLICWAVGGIDCRYLVSPGGLFADAPELQQDMASRVASITTLGTPHRGTYVATAALLAVDATGDQSTWAEYFGVSDELDRFVDPALLADDLGVRAQLHRLQPSEMERFNERTPDEPTIAYQSYAGVTRIFGQPYLPSDEVVRGDCRSRTLGRFQWNLADDDIATEIFAVSAAQASRHHVGDGQTRAAPSDGMISVPSARWGTFRGCVPADHYDLVGQFEGGGVDPNSGFDALTFHLAVLADLAAWEAAP